jgi:hypothetical protein
MALKPVLLLSVMLGLALPAVAGDAGRELESAAINAAAILAGSEPSPGEMAVSFTPVNPVRPSRVLRLDFGHPVVLRCKCARWGKAALVTAAGGKAPHYEASCEQWKESFCRKQQAAPSPADSPQLVDLAGSCPSARNVEYDATVRSCSPMYYYGDGWVENDPSGKNNCSTREFRLRECAD